MHPAHKDVRIEIINGRITVEIPDCPVSKGHGDIVRWVSDTGPWDIVFANSPFGTQTKFSIPANGGKSLPPTPAVPVTQPDGQYKYSVTGPSGTLDPNIIVKG